VRILLDEDDFRQLVAGKVIDRVGVKIALSDIGFDRMESAIDLARTGGTCSRCLQSNADCFCMGGPR
jgi:hypothetical protein